jgi:hypothetical protein
MFQQRLDFTKETRDSSHGTVMGRHEERSVAPARERAAEVQLELQKLLWPTQVQTRGYCAEP